MRRLIAVGVLAAVIAAVCLAGHVVISDCGKVVGAHLLAGIDAAERGDADTALAEGALAEAEFARREARLDFFIHHDLVEELGMQLAKLQGLAAEDTLPEYLSEAGGALTMLTHVVNDERPTLLNVF